MSNDKVVIPENYDEWRYCIEVLGKIELTSEYVGERLAIMQDGQHPETRKFVKLYGEEHLQRTVEWFRRAESELP